MRTSPLPLLCSLSLLAPACGGDGDGGDVEIESYRVTGAALDFETRQSISGTATVTASGLEPPPAITVEGADFTIEEIPPHSVFHLLVGSPPDYRSTYNVATEVREADLEGVTAGVMSEAYIQELAAEFGVQDAGGVLVARAVDENGTGLAGVPASAFALNGGAPASGPFFLDADLNPDAGLTESSGSGYAVFFEVEPGLTAVTAAEGSDYSMVAAQSPVAGTAVTLAEVVVTTGGEQELPMNVSFSQEVVPIFEERGCSICHAGGGIGRDQGDLSLQGSASLQYRELVEEISPNQGIPRVDLEVPEESLVLTMPSAEDPPDSHPNVTFASAQDPDYQIILAWIIEGAQNN